MMDALICFNRTPDVLARVVCLPYAGGSARMFRGWRAMDSRIEAWGYEYPGRGARRGHPHADQLASLAQEVADALLALSDRPLILFGHSLGGFVAAEAGRRICRAGLQPTALLVSGCRAAHLPSRQPVAHDLPREEFIERLKELNGTPDGLIADQELLDLMMPILRADFRLAETYHHDRAPALACPIIAFGGLTDPQVQRDEIEAWAEHTISDFKLRMLPGDHFFIHHSETLILETVRRDLGSLLSF